MSPTPAPRVPPSLWYARRHWQGKLPFLATFWVNVLALRLVIGVGIVPLLPAPLPTAGFVALVAADIGLFAWQAVGLIRFGDQQARSSAATGPSMAGLLVLALFLLMAFVTWWQLFLTSPLAPARPDLLRAQPDPPPLARLSLSADGTQLQLDGTIALGTRRRVEAVLHDAPGVGRLDLSSGGGHVHAARNLARFVQQRGLATHVSRDCSSACTLVFMAGHVRSLGPGARLGFHSYHLDVASGLPNVDPAAEMQKDLVFLQAQGLAVEFLQKIPAIPAREMWFPRRDVLVAAGVIPR
ncbi:hypothetical protein [Aliiroseovarius subalbicans]|uniref:COG3904 family protein n=1 Tax=Aliiroseovarius subalbicans TaxID=2925840 RepID=UPI001F588E10|nr:hypothetical protein [Aliiroseovarius subalbicans]MCI2398259.1 hypothetical protein [Aliiroseovarius subalbicans]